MAKRIVKLKLSKKLHRRLDSVDDMVFLDLSNINNERVDASDIDYVSMGADASDILIENFRGELDIGRAEQVIFCRQLRLSNCRVKTMTASRVIFENCEFVDCNFAAIRAIGVSLVKCVFSGVVRTGIFDCKNTVPGLQEISPFESNDFGRCDLRNTEFRGGVDLKKQTFNDEQQRLIIPSARDLLVQLDRYLAKGSRRPGVRRFRDFIHQSVVDFDQQEIFVSTDTLKNILWSYLQDFRGDYAAVSPAFARWAKESERICASHAVARRSRKS